MYFLNIPIQSYCSLAVVITSTPLRRFFIRNWYTALGPFLYKSISEIRPGVQSLFRFIVKMFVGVEVRALGRSLEFFHITLFIPCLHMHRDNLMLEHVWPQHVWKNNSITQVKKNLPVACDIRNVGHFVSAVSVKLLCFCG